MKASRIPATLPELNPTLLCGNTVTQHRRNLTTAIAPNRLRRNPANCHSEDAAGDEESGIALKTIRARSFAAAPDDSIGVFFRSLLVGFRKKEAKREPPNKVLKIKGRHKKDVKNKGTSQ
jgi:hypothetical protein